MKTRRDLGVARVDGRAKANAVSLVFLVFTLSGLAPDLAAQCTAHWGNAFPTGAGSLNADVLALANGETSGGAPVLYAGGSFDAASPAIANHVAMWDGVSWSALGSGMDDSVRALTVVDDDGAGPNPSVLYAGGEFTTAGGVSANRIAKWDGSSWSPLSSGMNSLGVYALAMFDDDGAGQNPPLLYAGGLFTTAGGVSANRIAKWDGSSWSPLSSGVSGAVYALTVFDDDGAGPNAPALYAGGVFTVAGGAGAHRVARWDGASWSPLGLGMNSEVRALAVFDDDGAGPAPAALYAGGRFTLAGGESSNHVARWNGTSWSTPSSGVQLGDVFSLTVFDEDGAGPNLSKLYAGGTFTYAGGVPETRIAKWDGASWSGCGSGVGNESTSKVMSLTVFDDDGAGPNVAALYAGGDFTVAGGIGGADDVARWNGASWSILTPGGGTDTAVRALTAFDADGAGANPPALIAGGVFTTAGSVGARRIAAWNGSSWSPLDAGLSDVLGSAAAYALLAFDDDGGGPSAPALFVGGRFTEAGSVSTRSVAKWDGTSWSAVGAGLTGETLSGQRGYVYAFASFDADGFGPNPPALYAGGAFTESGGAFVDNLGRWNGSLWLPVGGGAGFQSQGASVFALAVFDDDGAGPAAPALFVGGSFTAVNQGSFSTARIARWSGMSWSTLGSGMNAAVSALAVFDDDGIGPHPAELYAGGEFTTAGGTPANRIAKWNGSSWSALGSGMDGAVSALSVFDDDGTGPNLPLLHAGGTFTTAGGVSANRIAKWDGSSWSALDGGIDGGATPVVNAMTVFDADASGPSPSTLLVGGDFTLAGSESSANVASRIGCGSQFESFCSGDGSLPTACPCVPPNTVPNPPAATGHGCANSLNLAGALLSANGSTSPDTLRFTVDVAPAYSGFAFLVKGNANAANGIASSDGVRCVNGQLIRFGGHNAGTNGDPSAQWSYPNAVQTIPVSVATAQPPTQMAYYQLFYRNAAANFCNAATANYSNGCVIGWQ